MSETSSLPQTPYHAKYFAHDLTLQGGTGVDRLTRSLFDACVDLNPHQIEASIFALRSPLSKGVLLADEVGLGKTIEAGLVLCQLWAEGKRRLLVICPASLRKQWAMELEEKFNLPTVIIDSISYRKAKASGNPRPFDTKGVAISSIHFASRYAEELRSIGWNMVTIDEAHKLRNSYRTSNKMGQRLRWALEDSRKILLTATPLQNSLLELYGLATLIDEHAFGDLPSFRTQYMGAGGEMPMLRNRLAGFCTRTLRRQVMEFIQYTERKLLTRPFTPSEAEHRLYTLVSEYLQREDSYAFPKSQRHLIVLVLRKLLASSTQAIVATLEALQERLIKLRKGEVDKQSLAEKLIEGEDIEDDLLDEILADGNEMEQEKQEDDDEEDQIDIKRLDAEIEDLGRFIKLARSIPLDEKTKSLLTALDVGFAEMERLGASRKALIFTESRRTQDYLSDYLEGNGYNGKVITFSGTNTSPNCRSVYERWRDNNVDSGRATGSRAVDMRTAIIDHFRDDAEIMIATEAGAEGINLQFCSLVINYDLPWNPQRVEQRIGRCHRYGQLHDVVVMNFLNKKNDADMRVHDLLKDKFKLFDGVFGASDDVLGSIESGVDFEKQILSIYQNCRTPQEIELGFKELRSRMDEQIETRMTKTRQSLLEHFDEDVHSRLKVNLEGTREQLDRIGKRFWRLTQHILDSCAEFEDDCYAFHLQKTPSEEIHTGRYHMISKEERSIPSEFLYRLSHPLGEHVLKEGKSLDTPYARVVFNITDHPTRISLVEALQGKQGWMLLQHLTIDSFDKEERILFSGIDEDGNSLSQETLEKLFLCNGKCKDLDAPPEWVEQRLNDESKRILEATINRSLEENNRFFNEERDRLDKWADDMEIAVGKELKATKEQIKALNRQARQAETMDEQHGLQHRIQELEKKKRRQRQQIFDIEDEIATKRDELIDVLEKRMKQKTKTMPLFMIQWEVE